jgi:hypothetical protein
VRNKLNKEERMLKIEVGKSDAGQATVLAVLLSLLAGQQAQSQAARPKTAAAHRPVHSGAPARGPAPSQASNAQITAYLQRLRAKLIQAWIIPDGNNHVTISGNFNQDGLSDNLKNTSSPHNENAEQSAMAAFNKCMPLETPPTGMVNGKVTVEFLSTADPHGDSKSSINLRMDPVAQPKAQTAAPAAGGQAAQPAAGESAPATAPVEQPAAAQSAQPAQQPAQQPATQQPAAQQPATPPAP